MIEPICGLCNRLIVLASAQRLADLYNRKLVVIWENNYRPQAMHSNSPFHDLFENDFPRIKSFDDVDPASLVRLVSFPRYVPWDSGNVEGAIALEADCVDLSPYRDIPVVGVTACSPLIAASDSRSTVIQFVAEFLLKLTPVPCVQAAVQNFRRMHFHGPVLGVHIRRGDHGAMLDRLGITQPTEEDFWVYVDECLSSQHDLRVFCASDDDGVKRRFIDRFGDRALSYGAASLDRTTTTGLRCALIDLLLLSHAGFVCGTPASSFTVAASFRNLVRRRWPLACAAEMAADIRHDRAELSRLVRRTLFALSDVVSNEAA